MEFIQNIFGADIQLYLPIIFNLIVIESLLSVDNAAVLATMVMDLPTTQRSKALKYGIIGAYVFRGLCLLFAAYLVNIWWLKPLGGLYLLYLAYDHFRFKAKVNEDETVEKETVWIYRIIKGTLGQFWATVVLVEVMDIAFSIDNVFAAVALTSNVYLVCFGVFVGILAMRFVAQAFVTLMEKYKFLETIAFLVIALLGVKLTLSLYSHFYEQSEFAQIMDGEKAGIYFSIITIGLFAIPLASSALLNFPAKSKN